MCTAGNVTDLKISMVHFPTVTVIDSIDKLLEVSSGFIFVQSTLMNLGMTK